MDTNVAIMTGRLVKEGDIYELNGERGGKVLHFTIAVQRMGIKNPKTNKYSYANADFIPCVLFDGSASMFYAQQVAGFIKKGTKIMVVGSNMTFSKPVDPDNPTGKKYTEMSVKVREFQVINTQRKSDGEKSCEDSGEKPCEDAPDYANDGSDMPFDL